MSSLVSLSQRFVASCNEIDTTLFLGVLSVPTWCGYRRSNATPQSLDSDGSPCGLTSSVFLWMRYSGARTSLVTSRTAPKPPDSENITLYDCVTLYNFKRTSPHYTRHSKPHLVSSILKVGKLRCRGGTGSSAIPQLMSDGQSSGETSAFLTHTTQLYGSARATRAKPSSPGGWVQTTDMYFQVQEQGPAEFGFRQEPSF